MSMQRLWALVCGVAVIVVVGVAGVGQMSSERVVQAERFELVDSDGMVGASLMFEGAGGGNPRQPVLKLYRTGARKDYVEVGSNGMYIVQEDCVRIGIHRDDDNSVCIRLYEMGGKARISMEAGKGTLGVKIFDHGARVRVALGRVGEGGGPNESVGGSEARLVLYGDGLERAVVEPPRK